MSSGNPFSDGINLPATAEEETFVMTIARQQRVGIAWCTAGSWAIRYCEIADSVPFLGLERTLKAIEPSLILTASNASDELKAMLLRVGTPAAAGTPPSETHEFDAFPSEKLLLTGCRGGGSPELMTGPNPLVFVRAEELTPERINATIRVWRNIERSDACRGLTVDSRLPAAAREH
ncbi:MutS protein msh5 [Cyanidiococcus yangmingshanensis]|uniref:MutS protein msh5 n=1 Tax=Cyanidiococcus yangmingshanensis TaxID=2690220 RepID=A0A7J7IHZ5_9RHOD|nr:MutS protein msh5 [Cyanidiococcus yangmingshanensis]